MDIKTTSDTRQSRSYRRDIVGLRGVAVLAVLLHHFEIPGFVGAFYGPDIFFVLSGYLITGSLVKEYSRSLNNNGNKGSISIRGLYLRRIRRIFPASVFVILLVNIYAYFYLNSLRAEAIRLDSLWTLLFAANVRFMRLATDYFSTEAVSPFIHFWSLAVTEQFYLVWPFIILAATKFGSLRIGTKPLIWKRQLLTVFAVLILTSSIWFVLVFNLNHSQAYFSTLCRAWELALGGIIAVLDVKILSRLIGFRLALIRGIALSVFLGSLVFVRPDNFGYTLFIPVIAVAFLIFSGSTLDRDLSNRILGSKLLAIVGTISYSLYLWHWPIFVFGSDLGIMNSALEKTMGILLAIILATFTYFFIEKPFMRIRVGGAEKPLNSPESATPSATFKSYYKSVVALALIGLILSAGLTIKSKFLDVRADQQIEQEQVTVPENLKFTGNYGIENFHYADDNWQDKIREGVALKELPENLVTPTNLLQDSAKWAGHGFDCMDIHKDLAASCLKGSSYSNQNPKAPKVVVLGGSFAEALIPAIFTTFDPKVFNIRGFILDQCAVADVTSILWTGEAYPECQSHRRWSFSQVAKLRPEYVVISANGRTLFTEDRSLFEPKLKKSLVNLRSSGAKIILISTLPHTGNINSCLIGKSRLGPKCFGSAQEDFQLRLKEKRATESAGGTFIDSSAWVCYATLCPAVIDNMIVSWDGSHLTTWFAKAISPLLRKELIKKRILH